MIRVGDTVPAFRLPRADAPDGTRLGVTDLLDDDGLLVAFCHRGPSQRPLSDILAYAQWFQFTDGLDVCVVTTEPGDVPDWLSGGPSVPFLYDETGSVFAQFGLSPHSTATTGQDGGFVLLDSTRRVRHVQRGSLAPDTEMEAVAPLKRTVESLTDDRPRAVTGATSSLRH
ncbi:hypothetical protein VB773_02625 [Haloarculaceae archaeon H-GB2-1]|nr:hypothetical protein [Haloarculaceae archaeon H-GB1-1]MEA5388549.1 hypothetical protein [Haloarculaceae archaeon H-GB11]MEA5406583.1 hypothetical protein [Haloarculaceae archaeon H-GB2-1]